MRILLVLGLVGCASHIRTEFVGTGTAVVAPRGTAPPAAPPGIALPRGSYDIAMRFDIPRAQVIDWRVSCPGAELTGAVGETFEAYRERRLGELRAMSERDRRTTATVTRVVAPRVVVVRSPQMVTPAGTVTVRGVRVEAVRSDAPADAPPVEPVVELSPYDDGRGVLTANVRVTTAAGGTCAIVATADDSIGAHYAVTRVRDLRVEQHERDVALATGAADVRTRMHARLVALGADDGARQRRREAEARAQAEAEARAGRAAQLRVEAELRERRRLEVEVHAKAEADAQLRHEAEMRARREAEVRAAAEARLRWEREAPTRARAELIVRRRTQAFQTREYLVMWLVGECHADPQRRARIVEQQRREREERERVIALRIETERAEQLRLRIERERRVAIRVEAERVEREARERQAAIRLEGERAERLRIRAEADARAERLATGAFAVRTQLAGYLVARGAVLRPPRPEAPHEERGEPPFPDARWTAGRWTWMALRWTWIPGQWSDPTRFGDAGGDSLAVREVVVEPPAATLVIAPPTRTVVVHEPAVTIGVPAGTIVVPAGVVRVPGASVHRQPPPPRRRPVVRDHRRADEPVVRDHRR